MSAEDLDPQNAAAPADNAELEPEPVESEAPAIEDAEAAEPDAEPEAEPSDLDSIDQEPVGPPTPELETIVPAPPLIEPAPPEPAVNSPGPTPRRRPSRLRRLLALLLILIIAGPPLQVVILRIVPPLFTELMVQRLIQGYGWDYQWRPLSQISRDMVQAAVASEDARFCSHHGFDFQAMEAALRHNERRPNGKVKGGSTISQQTAKNVFLWPGRSYVRKGIEAWYTVLIEALWGKRRIMEVYLNVVEFGPGVYGAQAASQHFFHEDASQLSPAQAAHLISVLPDPLKWRVAAPGAYVARRSRRIDGAIGTVRDDGLAGCVGR